MHTKTQTHTQRVSEPNLELVQASSVTCTEAHTHTHTVVIAHGKQAMDRGKHYS